MDTHIRVDENKIIEETRYCLNNNVDVYTILNCIMKEVITFMIYLQKAKIIGIILFSTTYYYFNKH